MSHSFAVVVRAGSDWGNLATALDVYVEDDEAHRFRPLAEVSVEFALRLRTEVFHVGEILIMDTATGREFGYPQRKPDKWNVEIEEFGHDLDAAIARSVEVWEASLRSQAAAAE